MNRAAIYALIALALLAGAFGFGHHVATSAWQTKWATRDASDIEAKAQHERDQRALEQLYHNKLNEVQTNARQAIDAAAADAAHATATADSMHELARKTAARCAASAGASATSGGKAATSPGMVLADVLARADARAGELAAAYDRARVAGGACERAYDSVRGSAQ